MSTISLRGGNLYLKAAVYDQYFRGVETVILLRRDDDLHIMPVAHAAAGGYLIKLKNAAGDRVISGADFFRNQGVSDDICAEFDIAWNTEAAALEGRSLFENNEL